MFCTMKLYVETYAGHIHKIDCELDDTIESIKEKVAEDFGPKQHEHTLIFKETELEDGLTLSDYNMQNEDTIRSFPGGDTRGGIKFVNPNNQITGECGNETSTELNKYKFFTPGANFVGKCDESTCRIHNVEQFLRKGFGTFAVNKEVWNQKCIACSKKFTNKEVTNILFYRCNFSFEGVTEGKKVEKSGSTPAGKYITF